MGTSAAEDTGQMASHPNTTAAAARPRWLRGVLACLAAATLAGCVYRLDVQQGNLLEETDVDAVQVGMTRNQVRFLLGTPVTRDSFRDDRWDYMYYLRPGKSKNATRRWVIVWFEGDSVIRVDDDVPVNKRS